jgi:hypothetical protein
MPLFGGACPHCEDYRAQRDRAQQELSVVLTEYAAAMRDAMAMKRHEMGIPPAGTSLTNPVDVLGPKTRSAIEQMSGGFSDQRAYLTNWAIAATRSAVGQGEADDETDTMIAHAIRQGDTG